jgi:hypothetical protein
MFEGLLFLVPSPPWTRQDLGLRSAEVAEGGQTDHIQRMAKPSIPEVVRLWAALNPSIVGFGACAGLVLILFAPFFPVHMEPVTGKIENINTAPARLGDYYMALVVVGGQRVQANLGKQSNCHPGDEVELMKTTYIWRIGYQASFRACTVTD